MKRNNVTVSITASTGDIEAKFAAAAKEIRALSTELTKLGCSIVVADVCNQCC